MGKILKKNFWSWQLLTFITRVAAIAADGILIDMAKHKRGECTIIQCVSAHNMTFYLNEKATYLSQNIVRGERKKEFIQKTSRNNHIFRMCFIELLKRKE